MSGALGACLMGPSASFSVQAGTYSDTNIGSDDTTSITYTNAGAVSTTRTIIGTVGVGNWVTPTAYAPGSYTIRAHVNSGALTSGTVDTDLALSSNRTWTVTQSGGAGTKTANLTITIKDSFGNTVATGTVVITAIRS